MFERNSIFTGSGVAWQWDNHFDSRQMPGSFRLKDAIPRFRRLIRDESNAFVVEAGLIVALILTVILVRVVQYAHGS